MCLILLFHGREAGELASFGGLLPSKVSRIVAWSAVRDRPHFCCPGHPLERTATRGRIRCRSQETRLWPIALLANPTVLCMINKLGGGAYAKGNHLCSIPIASSNKDH